MLHASLYGGDVAVGPFSTQYHPASGVLPGYSKEVEAWLRAAAAGDADAEAADPRLVQLRLFQQGDPCLQLCNRHEATSGSLEEARVVVWRCECRHGFFSLFNLALCCAEQCERQGSAFLVDWSSPKLLYCGPPGRPNLWSAFFEQPAELRCRRDDLLCAIAEGLHFDWHGLPPQDSWILQGVIEDWGGLTPECAARGRGLCRRNIALNAQLLRRVRAAAGQLLGGRRRWLAVHIRRTDKSVEAPVNFALSTDNLAARILVQCKVWGCDGVFLCTDDPTLKQELTARLAGAPLAPRGKAPCSSELAVSAYPSTLSSWGAAAHMDAGLDGYKKANDIVMECLLMAQCHGLLSTFSNVSVAAVFLSGDDYPYTYFSVSAQHQALATAACPRVRRQDPQQAHQPPAAWVLAAAPAGTAAPPASAHTGSC